jgi:threonine/homoserine/homoserine lactone efflux protein
MIDPATRHALRDSLAVSLSNPKSLIYLLDRRSVRTKG